MEELGDALARGEVRVQAHPENPMLRIYNYTEETQYRNRWNKITLACRGLILDLHPDRFGTVVARPWEKFFNFGQMDNRIESTAPVEVTDKVDGSLGILYQEPHGYKNWCIATRGSFASEQAEHATEVLATKYADVDFYDEANTYLFEIVYPSNRIVVNYGDQDDLILLGAVNKQYGHYFGPQTAQAMLQWPGPVTESWHYEQFVDALSAPDREGMEGYVIRSGNKIVKLKQADYVELHRIVTNLSPKTIWEAMGGGKTIADICAEIPDEFHKYVTTIGDRLNEQASDIVYRTRMAYHEILPGASVDGVVIRRRFAQDAADYPDIKKYLFLLLDGRDIKDTIWHHIKPRGDIKSLVEDEG
jgi:RNA ligase